MQDEAGHEHGGCLCGAVRYRVTGRPLRSGICHCRTCRKVSSAPALPFAVFAADAFTLQMGAPLAFASSPGVLRSFCGQCGSPLTYRNDADPDFVDVMTGSLDDPDAFPPTYHVWTSQKIGWDVIGGGLPMHRDGCQD